MRTTLDIDDDIVSAAKEIARAEGRTAGEVLSDLSRNALTGRSAASGFAEEQAKLTDSDLPAFPTLPNRTGRIVTTEQVKRIQLETELEDGFAWDHEADKPHDFSEDDKKKR